jgi:hypothetical protein
LTVTDIELELTVAVVRQEALEVSWACTMSPESNEECEKAIPAAWYTPFLYHEIEGELPPLAMVAVKETEQERKTVVDEVAVIEIDGVTGAETAKGGYEATPLPQFM